MSNSQKKALRAKDKQYCSPQEHAVQIWGWMFTVHNALGGFKVGDLG